MVHIQLHRSIMEKLQSLVGKTLNGVTIRRRGISIAQEDKLRYTNLIDILKEK